MTILSIFEFFTYIENFKYDRIYEQTLQPLLHDTNVNSTNFTRCLKPRTKIKHANYKTKQNLTLDIKGTSGNPHTRAHPQLERKSKIMRGQLKQKGTI